MTVLQVSILLASIPILCIAYLRLRYTHNKTMPTWLRNSTACYIFQHCLWYRMWYGGRWEKWFIEMTCSYAWLPIRPGMGYPNYFPCSARGIPVIENWPIRKD